ncbi:MAG: hypothetical protein QHJ82_17255 [Verrucomicrobiota bacterium]|nr:hypothetical protein [Verrucomicrobiota bacterium]
MKTGDATQFLKRILKIKRMERGKLTVIGQGPSGPYYKLQCWENGRNFSRYIHRDQVPAVKEALEGYRLFRQLTDQYAQSIIDRTRAELAGESKKRRRLSRNRSGRRKRKPGK